ncbi:MAG: divalent-cation tolerance protein CutA [Planctomycetes bacterium]|nr:divalent-cation tolerance protein CutA [Planctomycetota bacterium]
MIRLFMVSHPVENADKLARSLVSKSLAACVHILPKGTSVYSWNGNLCEEEEVLLLVKTAAEPNLLTSEILEAHPHDCPEIIGLDISTGHQDYLDWILKSTKGTP